MKTMKTEFKQKGLRVGSAGSFINQLMSHNASIPEVGKGATELMYSDRHAYEVIEVSKDFKTVKLEALNAKAAPGSGMGDQNWILTPSGRFSILVWNRGAWRKVGKSIVFTEEMNKKHEAGYRLTEAEREAVYKGELYPQAVIEGITRMKTTYTKVNIIFGSKAHYYDWSF